MRKSVILVVEDEKEIGILLKKYLEVEGFIVKLAYDGEEGYKIFNNEDIDLVITDIMMPILDGIELCKKIRKNSNVPIMLLTAKDEEVDKLIGLMLGADDYVTKPFSVKEVVARAKAMLRRFLELSNSFLIRRTLEVNGLFIDFENEKVCKNGDDVQLRTKEYEILSLLAKTPDKVYSKSQIFESVWHSKYNGDDNTLMVHMRRLRKKIEEDSNNPKFIKTVWGLGYKFNTRDDRHE